MKWDGRVAGRGAFCLRTALGASAYEQPNLTHRGNYEFMRERVTTYSTKLPSVRFLRGVTRPRARAFKICAIVWLSMQPQGHGSGGGGFRKSVLGSSTHPRNTRAVHGVCTATFYKHRMQLYAQPRDYLAHCTKLRSMHVRGRPRSCVVVEQCRT